MECAPCHHQGPCLLNSDPIEPLWQYWKDFISGLEMTPTELRLSKIRAERALDLARRSNRNKKASSSKYDRPLTALYSSPRTTCRMKKILDKQVVRPTRIKGPQDESPYFLCPQCGLVKDHCITHEKHADRMRQRLKWLLAKHPNLQPNSERFLL